MKWSINQERKNLDNDDSKAYVLFCFNSKVTNYCLSNLDKGTKNVTHFISI